jgi:hypothetical protein
LTAITAKSSIVRRMLRWLWIVLGFAFVAGAGYILPNSYQDAKIHTIVPEDTPQEKITGLLTALSEVQRLALIKSEKEIFSNEPLDSSTLVNLSVLYSLQGDKIRADRLTQLGADRSYRDMGAQVSAMRLSLENKDFSNALYRLDGLLRSNPKQAGDFFQVLNSVAGTEVGLKAVTTLLKTNPPWRQQYLNDTAVHVENSKLLYQIFTDLRKLDVSVEDAELRPFLYNLMGAKSYEAAYFVWLDSLSPEALRKTGMIFDGSFDLTPRNMTFDWNIIPAKNAEITVKARPGSATNRSLKLQLLNAAWSQANVYQYMRLGEGAYHLSAEAMAENLKTDGGLLWKLSCIESGVTLGRSPILAKSGPWLGFDFDFTIPAEGCNTQIIGLNPASSAALDQVISGRVYYDNFKIVKSE